MLFGCSVLPPCFQTSTMLPLDLAQPRLLDKVRIAMRTRHYSRATELAYVGWIKRFILFHHKTHPQALGEADVASFLNHLAIQRRVSPSTQNQALAALLFLYREVLARELGWVEGIVRARNRMRRPTLLSLDEVMAVLDELSGKARLIVTLLYGSGMRVNECLRVRVKDIDIEPARSWSSAARAARTGRRSCPGRRSPRYAIRSKMCVESSRPIAHAATARPKCRRRSRTGFRKQACSGRGSSSFRACALRPPPIPAGFDAIPWTTTSCSARCTMRRSEPALQDP